MYMDLCLVTSQGRNNNCLLNKKLGSIHQVADGSLTAIDCKIQLGYHERMYHAQSGMLYIPQLSGEQLARLHGIAMCISRISDPIYKREQILGKLYTKRHRQTFRLGTVARGG
jgi:hypothetical protein